MSQHTIHVTVNGEKFERIVDSRTLLIDFIREDLGLTGTHAGCEHGVCGTCTIQLDGEAVRSCTMFAVQADGRSLRTVESLADGGRLSRLQQALKDHHGLQCGYCTSGLLMTLDFALRKPSELDLTKENEVRALISGNLCRCTGYQNIVNAVMSLADNDEFKGQ